MHMRPTPGTITPTGFLVSIFTTLKHTLPTDDILIDVKNNSLLLYQEKKKVANKTSEMKRTRRGRREMEEVMFNLFEGHSNWTLRLLIQETDQPEVKAKREFYTVYSA